MTIRYFPDTDTALIDLANSDVAETKAVSDNLLLDLDSAGNLVSITIEHAKENGTLSELVYREIRKETA